MARAKKQAFEPAYINDIVTPVGRVSFPHLVKPDSKGRYADDKYKVTLLIDKGTSLKRLKAAVQECIDATEAWDGLGLTIGDVAGPFRDGDEKGIEEYEDTVYITCKSNRRPLILDEDRGNMDAEEIYAGCRGRLVVTAMSYENKGDPGVTFLLDTVQFKGDDEAFGGGGGHGSARAALESADDEDDEDERPWRKAKSRRRDEDDEDDELYR